MHLRPRGLLDNSPIHVNVFQAKGQHSTHGSMYLLLRPPLRSVVHTEKRACNSSMSSVLASPGSPSLLSSQSGQESRCQGRAGALRAARRRRRHSAEFRGSKTVRRDISVPSVSRVTYQGQYSYDFFYKNGVPRWRGTGYYYARFRPGLGVSSPLLAVPTLTNYFKPVVPAGRVHVSGHRIVSLTVCRAAYELQARSEADRPHNSRGEDGCVGSENDSLDES